MSLVALVYLSVCVLATLLKKILTDCNEIFMEGPEVVIRPND